MDFDLKKALRAQAEGKAFGPHPALMSYDPVSIYQPGYGSGTPRKNAKLTQESAARHLPAYGGDQAIDWVYDCIGLYSDPVASAPYKLTTPEGVPLVRFRGKDTPKDHKDGPEELYKLLDNPNPYMLYEELVSLLVIDLLLVGNAYWMKWGSNEKGQPLALYRLAPSYVKIIPDTFGPKSYEYQPPGAKTPVKLTPQDVIHFRRPNPHDAYYGMGVIQGAGRSMDLEIALTDTITSYYENKADPSLIIQSERRIPKDVFRKLAQQLRQRVSGSANSGNLLVLEAGLNATTLSKDAQQMMFDSLQGMVRDRLFVKFRASPALFGIMDESGGGANKVSDYRREFDNYALRPFMDRIQGAISDALAAAYGAVYIIDHSYQSPPDEQIKVAQQVAATPGVKVREVRRQLSAFGIEESTGDEAIDEFVLNMPTPELDENGQIIDPITGVKKSGGKADRPLAGEAGRPPKGSNTKGFGVAGAKAMLDEIDLRVAMAQDRLKIEGKALTNPDGSNATVGNRMQGEIPPDPFALTRAADIAAAQEYMVAELAKAATTLERGLLDHVEGKAFKQEDLVGRVRKSASWGVFKAQVEAILMEGARRSISSAAMHSADAGLVPDDALDYDDIAKSVVGRPTGVRKIVKTLKDRVAMRIMRAVNEQDPIQAVVQGEVQKTIAEWKVNQANLIATTEATHAFNESTLTIAELTGHTHVVVIDGEEDDQPCIDAHGATWPIDFAREHRLEHPGCARHFIATSTLDTA